jgi:hypothetical protein
MDWRNVEALLVRAGARLKRHGDGSHQVWAWVVDGRERTFVFAPHGAKHRIDKSVIKRLRRTWKLEPENGVSDAEFLSGNWRTPGSGPPK